MRTESSLLLLAAILVPSMAGAQVEHADRSKEGNWSIMDQTDNNPGDREVCAMLTHYEPPDRDFVNLFIKCTDRRHAICLCEGEGHGARRLSGDAQSVGGDRRGDRHG